MLRSVYLPHLSRWREKIGTKYTMPIQGSQEENLANCFLRTVPTSYDKFFLELLIAICFFPTAGIYSDAKFRGCSLEPTEPERILLKGRMVAMKVGSLLVFLMILVAGCGTDKPLLEDAKFDKGLRDKIDSLPADTIVSLLVEGTCSTSINGPMRQDLIDAGADVQVMKGDKFTARVSSDDLFDVAALEFVSHLKLAKK